jgi:tetratricopeptide (TPR) repeat protein
MTVLCLILFCQAGNTATDPTIEQVLARARSVADPAERIEILEQAIKNPSAKGEPLAQVYFQAGLAYEELKDYFRAVEYFNYCVAYTRNVIPAFLEKTHCLILLGQLDEASKLLETILASASSIAQPYVLKGMIYEKEGLLVKAEDEFTRALNYEPHSISALEMRANVRIKQGKPIKALEDTSALIRLSPDKPEALLTRARIHVKLKEYQAALDDYHRVESLRPADVSVVKEKVLVYFMMDRAQKALEVLSAFSVQHPDDVEALALTARAYIAVKNVAEAERVLKKAFAKNASYAPAYLYHGLALARKQDPDGALDSFNRAIELEPTLVEAYKERARIFMDLKEYVRAAADLTRAANLDPGDAETLALRGLTSMERMLYDAAAADFTKALESSPGDPRVLYDRAVAHMLRDDQQAAMVDVEAVLRVMPNAARALCMRGIIRYRLGSIEEAREDFQKAVDIAPYDPLLWNNRGFFLYKIDDRKDALESFNQALKLEPEYKSAQYNLRVLTQKNEAAVLKVQGTREDRGGSGTHHSHQAAN